MTAIPEPETLLSAVVDIAEEVGQAVMAIYATGDLATTTKDETWPVTRADRLAHRLFVSGLAALAPDLPVVSEEGALPSYSERQRWRAFWLVDPLDGTKEFIGRLGEFSLNIALIRDNRPVLGVVHAPAMEVTYFAAAEAGAFKRGAAAPAQRIGVSAYQSPPVKIVGSRFHRGEGLEAFLGNLGAVEYVAMGSALKFCLVAEGAAHLYPRLGPTMEWDSAAAQCVLEEAGGSVRDLQGARLTYNKPDIHNPCFIACAHSAPVWHRYLTPTSPAVGQ